MDYKNIFSKLALQVTSNPSLQLSGGLTKLKKRVSSYFFDWKSDRQYSLGTSKITRTFSNRLGDIKFKGGKTLYILLATIIAVILIFGFIRLLSSGKSTGTSNNSISKARKTTSINKEFQFPLRDNGGDEVSKIKYKLEQAELRDEIVVKGQKATAIKGREFLIITLKISNEHNQSIEINTKDYVRLSVNKNENEWLAPDIHNDPVMIQAISTKYTRIGFPINVSDKDLVLQVGEINGNKEKLKLDF